MPVSGFLWPTLTAVGSLHAAWEYAFLKKPHHWEPPAPEIRYLGALLRRRDVLLGDALPEENRQEKPVDRHTCRYFQFLQAYGAASARGGK